MEALPDARVAREAQRATPSHRLAACPIDVRNAQHLLAATSIKSLRLLSMHGFCASASYMRSFISAIVIDDDRQETVQAPYGGVLTLERSSSIAPAVRFCCSSLRELLMALEESGTVTAHFE